MFPRILCLSIPSLIGLPGTWIVILSSEHGKRQIENERKGALVLAAAAACVQGHFQQLVLEPRIPTTGFWRWRCRLMLHKATQRVEMRRRIAAAPSPPRPCHQSCVFTCTSPLPTQQSFTKPRSEQGPHTLLQGTQG